MKITPPKGYRLAKPGELYPHGDSLWLGPLTLKWRRAGAIKEDSWRHPDARWKVYAIPKRRFRRVASDLELVPVNGSP